jgi:tellurite resistance protein TerA
MPIDYTKRPATRPAVSLTKVSLTKAAPAVSLTKQGSATGVLRVNLNWNARPAGGAPIDLDLGCLYEYSDGRKGVVQALGDALEDDHDFGGLPICRLDGDDRSGGNDAGENLFVDLGRGHLVRRILVFAFIYEGVPNWAAANGVVTVFPAAGPQIEVLLDEPDDQARMCAIVMLENNGNDLSVRREIRYVRGGHSTMDQAYGWGMHWTPGRK